MLAIAPRRNWRICREVPSAAFSAMLPLKPSVRSRRPRPADAVALDKPDIFELRQVHRAQQFGGFANFLVALHLLDADIEQAHGRPLQAERDARHGAAHHRQRHQMMRIAADGGAEIEHDRIAAHRRPHRRERRAVDPGSMRRQKRAMATSAPVLPAETATPASPFLTASIASHIDDVLRPRRNAWLGLSSMLTATSVWMTRGDRLQRRIFCQLRIDLTARSPNRRNSVSGCRVSEIAAPGITTAAPTSPPMASSAIRTFCGMNVPETNLVGLSS